MPESAEVKSLPAIIADLRRDLSRDKRISMLLPPNGRIYIDSQLPFLCVYRRRGEDDAFDGQLITTQAAFFIAPDSEGQEDVSREICEAIIETLTPVFGRCLVLEIWLRHEEDAGGDSADQGITVVAQSKHSEEQVVTVMLEVMKDVLRRSEPMQVRLSVTDKIRPPERLPLLGKSALERLNCLTVGLECPPVYRDSRTSQFFPSLYRDFRGSLGVALQRSFHAFRPREDEPEFSYEALAPTRVRREAEAVDQKLEAVAAQFDFLLYVTPVNSMDAWEQFYADDFERTPSFSYRPLPFETRQLKRDLYQVRLEQVEDPILWQIFAEKQDELDMQISLLRDRGSPHFRHGSTRLYGSADAELLALARNILSRGNLRSGSLSDEPALDAKQISERAYAEIAYYRSINPEFDAHVEITNSIAAGMMTSRNRLLVSSSVLFPANRVEALLNHEIGTHLLTWFNGRAQPLRMMQYGLAGYEPLQEGLAVLAEYLCGGLDPPRLRTLAGRVEAVHCMEEGATFVETFRRLRHDHEFSAKASFRMTTRVFRGGGLTKDAVYLRGLKEVFEHLSKSDSIEPLLAGKIALRHVPALHVLSQRRIIKPPALLPRYLDAANRRWLKEQTKFTFNRLLQDLSHPA